MYTPIKDRSRVVIVDGIRFVKEKRKSGYWYPSEWRKKKGRHPALHVYIWEKAHGCKVPDGYIVHHIDFNKDNNTPENLVAMTASEHGKIHGNLLTEERRAEFVSYLVERAQPKAKKWHRSEAGREWHSNHAKNMCDVLNIRVNKICKCCGKSFLGYRSSKFCSNACKSKWRRANHIDDINVVCPICGKVRRMGKYDARKHPTCGPHCASVYRKRIREHVCHTEQ